jgi:transcriptional regulator with XRE-family HTH domain
LPAVIGDVSMIGARVRAVRVRQGLSPGALAAATGLSKAHLSLLERGERSLDRLSTLQVIADALRTPVSELTGQPFPPRNPAENAAHAAALDIRDVLICTELGEHPGGTARPPATLERELWRVERLKELSDYAGFGPLLPALLTDAHAAVAGDDRAAGLSLVVRCCFAVEHLYTTTGRHVLAWIAAERALAAARLAEDPTLIGAANVLRGFALVHAGIRPRERALAIVTRGAEELSRHPMTDDGAEVLGMLHLIAAFAHTAAGRPGPAEDHLSEATSLAERTGDRNAFGLWFGPTNVGVWRVALAVEAGEGGAVAELAAKVNDALLPPYRRAGMLTDVGRGLARERGRHAEAIQALLRAEALAPHQVHADPFAREAVAALLFTAAGSDLRDLAHRAGVT